MQETKSCGRRTWKRMLLRRRGGGRQSSHRVAPQGQALEGTDCTAMVQSRHLRQFRSNLGDGYQHKDASLTDVTVAPGKLKRAREDFEVVAAEPSGSFDSSSDEEED
ncbi:uncharacterized protein LOC9662028 [Selaginella moellendorffii]|nr:uncharacterized protein LOC9662028 [Selaginella moellendorffii]|eukprot:XP_024518219.1 uncharacterized protein LOC9662028 [Selaginella moellendorffii]